MNDGQRYAGRRGSGPTRHCSDRRGHAVRDAERIGGHHVAVDVPLPAGASAGVNQHSDQFDIALLNATTGVRFSLPTAVNTSTADEFHPSITPDGKWLAFERVDPSAGTTRILATNLTTGQTADLFNTFDVGTLQPTTPFVEPDGSAVLTGAPFSLKPQWTETSLSSFPNSPFTHTQTQFPIVEQMDGQTFDPVDSSFASAATVVNGSNGSEAVVVHRVFADGGSDTVFIGNGFDRSASIGFAHPALSDPATDVEVIERRSQGSCVGANQCAVLGQLGYLSGGVAGKPIALPVIVNASGLDEAFPAFTPDGRYLGFVRQNPDNHDRLFVFDTITQTLLNDQGVDLGILGGTVQRARSPPADRGQPLAAPDPGVHFAVPAHSGRPAAVPSTDVERRWAARAADRRSPQALRAHRAHAENDRPRPARPVHAGQAYAQLEPARVGAPSCARHLYRDAAIAHLAPDRDRARHTAHAQDPPPLASAPRPVGDTLPA
jgi:hypothetical protein